jgi:hypothetical protein
MGCKIDAGLCELICHGGVLRLLSADITEHMIQNTTVFAKLTTITMPMGTLLALAGGNRDAQSQTRERLPRAAAQAAWM